MPKLELSVAEFRSPLKTRLTIARGSEGNAHTALARIRWNGIEGIGEAAPIARYKDSVADVRSFLEQYRFAGDDPYMLDDLLAPIPRAARCAVDLALHDIIGKDVDRPLWRLLGVDKDATPKTAYTIGIDGTEAVLELVKAHLDAPVLKIKLGLGREIETIEAIRSCYNGVIYIDANEGWTPEQSVELLSEMERLGIEFCEQPIPSGTPERLRWIRERVRVPIVADEDVLTAADLAPLYGCVDGVNIKLAKCGGIRAALEMIHGARALGFRILLGCMAESSVLATAAAHLSPLVDWADLDGPLLIAQDHFEGVRYEAGKLVLPDGPGLGVCARAATTA